jgi:predicted GIY-YIG superfamily endonuclease
VRVIRRRLKEQYPDGAPPGALARAAAIYVGEIDDQQRGDGIATVPEVLRVSVYLAFFGESDRAQFLKIGVARNVRSRMKSHRSSNPLANPLTLAAEFPDRPAACRVEQALLAHMRQDRVTGEWVAFRASLDACRAVAVSLAEVASTVHGNPVEFREI